MAPSKKSGGMATAVKKSAAVSILESKDVAGGTPEIRRDACG
jgi:hypothetical protein